MIFKPSQYYSKQSVTELNDQISYIVSNEDKNLQRYAKIRKGRNAPFLTYEICF